MNRSCLLLAFGFGPLWGQTLASSSHLEIVLDAHVEAAISEAGTLQGTVTIEANRAGASALGAGSSQVASFLKDRRMAGPPESTTTADRNKLRVVIREEQFVIPIERVKQTPLNAVPLAIEPVRRADGNLYLGVAGVYREKIDVGTAANRRIKASLHLDVDRPFAHYRSDAAVLDGHLLITRELELRSDSVAAGDADSAQSLLTQVREDQERQFAMARVGEVDWKNWADSIPPQQLDALAYRAASANGEFGAALLLAERATRVNPKDPNAWGLTAVIQRLLGHDRAAKAAYEQQVDLQPENAPARQALDDLMTLTGEADRVIEGARTRLQANPRDSAALASLQGAAVVAKRWADAEQALLRGLELRTDPASQSAGKQGLSVYRACQDKSDNPGQEIEAALGPDPSPFELSLTVATLKDCQRHLDLASGYCNKFFALVEPLVPATTTNLISLTEFPSIFAGTLFQCGYVQIEMGEVDAGLERILAAARISPIIEIQKEAAKAFWDAGRAAEAEQLWAEAISFNPEVLADVPKDLRDRIRPARTDIIFPGWIPVPDATELEKDKVEPGEELFFLVRADEFGVVTEAFDLNIVAAASVQLALRGMRVPVIPFDGRSIPSVHVVMVRNMRGKPEVFRSFATPTLNMVRSMRQDLFRPFQQAVR